MEPRPDCPLCPRLAAYRQANRAAQPGWHNAPVPGWGDRNAAVAVIGLAPGLRGANRTGQPFTGDHSGALLFRVLRQFGLAELPGQLGLAGSPGHAAPRWRIVNAVRCVPPGNLPTMAEVAACNRFLQAELAAMPALRAVLALGGTAHAAALRSRGLPASRLPFRHGALHRLPDGLLLADSYHVSRINTNTGRLTEAMFAAVVAALLGQVP